MKLVREYINEKFVKDSDPIQDMGIGVSQLIPKQFEKLHELNSNRRAFTYHTDIRSGTFNFQDEFPDSDMLEIIKEMLHETGLEIYLNFMPKMTKKQYRDKILEHIIYVWKIKPQYLKYFT